MTAETIEDYIGALDEPARGAVRSLVETARRVAPGRPEKLRYGMPAFELHPGRWMHFGAWKNHIGMYPVSRLPAELEERIHPYRTTTSTVNLPLAQSMPLELVAEVLRAVASGEAGAEGAEGAGERSG